MKHTDFALTDTLILVVDDDESSANMIRSCLSEFDNVQVLHDSAEALALCRSQTPDLILLDVNMPDIDGLTVCRELREMSLLNRCPILFMSSNEDIETEVKSWEAGGSDFLRKPIVAAALKMRVMSHLTSHWHIEIANKLYHTDTLTGLYNRYYFDKHVQEQISYANRYMSDLALLIVDINRFEAFNNRYGHAQGDKALRQIANVVKKTVSREPDCVCRFGGEEFTAILPATDLRGGNIVADKITLAVKKLGIPFDTELQGLLSVCVGVSSLRHSAEQNLSLFVSADENLCAKKQLAQSKVA